MNGDDLAEALGVAVKKRYVEVKRCPAPSGSEFQAHLYPGPGIWLSDSGRVIITYGAPLCVMEVINLPVSIEETMANVDPHKLVDQIKDLTIDLVKALTHGKAAE